MPVVSAPGGEKIGVAAVTGDDAVLQAVRSVAALQGTFQDVVRIHALVPTAAETPTGADPRLAGAQIVGVRITAEPSPPPDEGAAEGGGPQ